MKFNYNFVKKGDVAPEKIEKNTFWLDVGNRIIPGVIDHHHGNSNAGSAAELFLNRYEELESIGITHPDFAKVIELLKDENATIIEQV